MRVSLQRPPYCSGCFQHKENRFIDFEAAYDGPVIPGSPANIPIDDLILCEDCVRRAAELLDLHGELATIAELQQIILDQQEEIASKDKTLTGALATIEELVDHPVKRPAGKPALIGVSDEVREQITRARYERNGTSPAPKSKPTPEPITAKAENGHVAAENQGGRRVTMPIRARTDDGLAKPTALT